MEAGYIFHEPKVPKCDPPGRVIIFNHFSGGVSKLPRWKAYQLLQWDEGKDMQGAPRFPMLVLDQEALDSMWVDVIQFVERRTRVSILLNQFAVESEVETLQLLGNSELRIVEISIQNCRVGAIDEQRFDCKGMFNSCLEKMSNLTSLDLDYGVDFFDMKVLAKLPNLYRMTSLVR
jgi:hypothetical protein